jgi:recombination protein RecA
MSKKQSVADRIKAEINKKYGKGVARNLKRDKMVVDCISSGSLTIDIASGVGGFPFGRVVEIFGGESSGKTTLMISVIANAQKQGKVCAFIDAEHAFDQNYAETLGVDMDELIFIQPDTMEIGLNCIKDLVEGDVDIVCFDSIAASVPEKELNGEVGDHTVGLKARYMSQSMRMMTGIAKRNNSLLLFSNQIREKIGVMFGSNITTPGGNALKFAASMRVFLRSGKKNKEDKKNPTIVTSTSVVARFEKNKVAPPHTTASYEITYYDGVYGINKYGEVTDLALENGLLEKAGSWYKLNGTNIGQGRNGAIRFLQDNEEVMDELFQKILKIYKD